MGSRKKTKQGRTGNTDCVRYPCSLTIVYFLEQTISLRIRQALDKPVISMLNQATTIPKENLIIDVQIQ